MSGATMSKARDDGDRGAAVVEMAVVVPVFILLVFGMLEFGLAFKDKLAMAAEGKSPAQTRSMLAPPVNDVLLAEIVRRIAAHLIGG